MVGSTIASMSDRFARQDRDVRLAPPRQLSGHHPRAPRVGAAAVTRHAALTVLLVVAVDPQQVVISFDDLTPKRRVTTQYTSRGVRFVPGAFIDTDPAARSGTQVLRAANPTSEFHTGPLTMEFTSGQRSVQMFAAGMHFNTRGVAEAFDAAGQRIARDGPKRVRANAYTTLFRLATSRPLIRRVTLHYESTAFESIDDLSFEGEAPAPLPTVAPVVKLSLKNADFALATEVTVSAR